MSFHCGQRQSGPAGARSNMLARRRSRLAERDPPRPGHAIGVLCIHMDFLVQPAHALWASLDYRRPWLLGPGLLQVGNHGQVLNRVAVIPPCWRACIGSDGHGGASAANSSSAAPSAAPALPASRLVHPAYRSAMTGAHLVQPVLAQMRLPYCTLCRSWIDLHYVPARLVKPAYADVMLRLSDVHLETSVSTALHALAAADSAIRSPVEISQCAGCCCGFVASRPLLERVPCAHRVPLDQPEVRAHMKQMLQNQKRSPMREQLAANQASAGRRASAGLASAATAGAGRASAGAASAGTSGVSNVSMVLDEETTRSRALTGGCHVAHRSTHALLSEAGLGSLSPEIRELVLADRAQTFEALPKLGQVCGDRRVQFPFKMPYPRSAHKVEPARCKGPVAVTARRPHRRTDTSVRTRIHRPTTGRVGVRVRSRVRRR